MKPITEDHYHQLTREVADATAAAERAKGSLTAHLKQLEEEHQCKTLEEAQKKLKKGIAERDAAKEKFDKAYTAYVAAWKT